MGFPWCLRLGPTHGMWRVRGGTPGAHSPASELKQSSGLLDSALLYTFGSASNWDLERKTKPCRDHATALASEHCQSGDTQMVSSKPPHPNGPSVFLGAPAGTGQRWQEGDWECGRILLLEVWGSLEDTGLCLGPQGPLAGLFHSGLCP